MTARDIKDTLYSYILLQGTCAQHTFTPAFGRWVEIKDVQKLHAQETGAVSMRNHSKYSCANMAYKFQEKVNEVSQLQGFIFFYSTNSNIIISVH